MKNILHKSILLLLIFCSCDSNKQTDITYLEKYSSEFQDIARINFKTIDTCTIKDLEGGWEITEIRNNPNIKGRESTWDEGGMFFGFSQDGELDVISSEPEYTESGRNITLNIKIINGIIVPAITNNNFEKYFGGYMEILKVNKNELVIRCGKNAELTKNIKSDEFWYLIKY